MTPMGSRRMLEVWSGEYSAVALPSRFLAAPAKKSALSMVPGTSNSRASRSGLPGLAAFGHGKLFGLFREHAREPGQDRGPFPGGGPGPFREGGPRGGHREVDVGGTREGDRFHRCTGGGIDNI